MKPLLSIIYVYYNTPVEITLPSKSIISNPRFVKWGKEPLSSAAMPFFSKENEPDFEIN